MKIETRDLTINQESLLGPENALFFRGHLKGQSQIELPDYWEKIIDETSITVHLTPIGAPQTIVVLGVQNNTVMLRAKPGYPVDCYYFVMGTRKDVPRVKVAQSS